MFWMIFSIFSKNLVFWVFLVHPTVVSVLIPIGQEMLCLPYEGFFQTIWSGKGVFDVNIIKFSGKTFFNAVSIWCPYLARHLLNSDRGKNLFFNGLVPKVQGAVKNI